MIKIRIGKTININWKIITDIVLEKDTLTVEMTQPNGIKMKIPDFELSDNSMPLASHAGGNTLTINLLGTLFKQLGNYTLSLWKDRNLATQTVVDAVDAFTLVKYTNEECEGESCGCELEYETVDLESEIYVSSGPKGEDGFSPYINEEGYWVTKDGVSDVKAQGPEGPAGTYDQGSGILIIDDVISVDTNTIATKAYVNEVIGDIETLLKAL